MTQYLLVAKQTCPHCEGTKTIKTQVWKEFKQFQEHLWDITNEQQRKNLEKKWWKHRGYHSWGYGCDDMPEMYVECPHCEGTGTIARELELDPGFFN